ncbi:hypothetical protein [Streptomyces sp. NPDC049555]|uniref:hypothetical protein n=1 Tax=Streptomyces sp. NPDC049555 TaxID=3154930 RepID=UPI00342017B1
MIDRAPVSEALRSALAEAAGKPCGLGQLPTLGGKPAPMPYLVLYPLGGIASGAPLTDQSEDAVLTYQVTVVAARTDQAEWLADRVRRAVLERKTTGEWRYPIKVPSAEIWGREIDAEPGIDPSSVGDGVVTYPLRFRINVSS